MEFMDEDDAGAGLQLRYVGSFALLPLSMRRLRSTSAHNGEEDQVFL